MPFPTLPAPLANALTRQGYEEPTSVQAAVLAEEATGRDLLVSARTGSGKTVAFGLALATDLLDGDQLPPAGPPLALVVAPTRELALQVSRELAWLYAAAGARIATCVGGMDPSKERRALGQGAHIVVGTPGRLRDHLERGALDLSQLKAAVLDEADEMLDMGFREDLEEILDATPDARRTLLFSATLPKPIVQLAKRYQRDAHRISTVDDDRGGHGDIAYQAVLVSPADIESAAVNLLRYHEAETAMLFCATRDNVRRLHATLTERGFAAVALSGEHSQAERNGAMKALRDGRAKVCVATDVAARGLDLPSLSLVIHVEVPRDPDTLQHRSGRTGRAGKKGTAVLIVPYPRRRRVDSLLRAARVQAEWTDAPTPDDIRAQDRERLLAALMEPVEFDEEDRALAQRLMTERSAEDIAAALVQAHRARMPQPEELIPNTTEGRQRDQAERHRPGFEDTVWFRMDVGRRQNADPRWILPLLCRRAHITKAEVGAIRIGPMETFFQVPRSIADRVADRLHRTAGDANSEMGGEDAIRMEPAPDGPPQGGRGHHAHASPRGPRAPHSARPMHKGKPKGRAPKHG